MSYTHTKMHNEQIVEQQLCRWFAVQTTTENNNNHLNSNEKLLKIFWDVRSIVDQLLSRSYGLLNSLSLSHSVSPSVRCSHSTDIGTRVQCKQAGMSTTACWLTWYKPPIYNSKSMRNQNIKCNVEITGEQKAWENEMQRRDGWWQKRNRNRWRERAENREPKVNVGRKNDGNNGI